MEICKGVHQLKINFHVTPDIERYVYVYILTGQFCYLIDTGVHDSEKMIEDYICELGYKIEDIHGIFLTHAHPDHMGGAFALQKKSGCPIYASIREKDWIEDIHQQFIERPIPNFDKLLQNSVIVDKIVDKDIEIVLEDCLSMKILSTPGHSSGSLSYLLNQKILFSGDAILVKGDIPIYTNVKESIDSLNKVLSLQLVEYYCPAWDCVYDASTGRRKILEAIAVIDSIQECVEMVMKDFPDACDDFLFEIVSQRMDMVSFWQNPLFKKTILSHIDYKNE